MTDDRVGLLQHVALEVPRSVASLARPDGYAVADLLRSTAYILEGNAGAIWRVLLSSDSATVASLVAGAVADSPEADPALVEMGVASFVESMVAIGLCRVRERDARSGVRRL